MTGKDSLESEPFRYTTGKDDRVQIWARGRVVKTLKESAAIRFLERVESGDAQAGQHLMARMTGQFKFGNERS